MHSRLAFTGLIVASTLVLSACGDDSTSGSSTDPTPESSDTSSQSDSDTSGAVSSDKNFADCSAIPAADMAPALGTGTATATVPPASTSCTYALDDPRLPSVSIEQFGVDDFADGWEGAKANIATTVVGAIDGTPTSVSGIGDDAEVVAGPGEGATPDSIGLVKLGDTIVRASVLDASGLTPDELAAVTTEVLRVISDHA